LPNRQAPSSDPVPTEIVLSDDDGISLVRLSSFLLRHRRLLIRLPLALAVVVGIIALVLPRNYTSQASFMPQSSDVDASQLSGLAASLGFSFPGGQAGESPEFYVALLSSRDIRDGVIEHSYVLPGRDGEEPRTGTLIDFYNVKGDTRDAQLLQARKRLEKDLRARVRTEAGLVELSATARQPEVAQQIGQRVIGLMNDFNLRTRQSQARDEREFVEKRLEQARTELLSSEDSMVAFLQKNRRGYETSPELQFEHGRLERRVTVRQQVYGTLTEGYERARIDEVRNTPVITVVDAPHVPPRADSRGVVLKVLLALLSGLVIALAVAAVRDYMTSARVQAPDDYAQLARLRTETWDEVRRLVKSRPR